MSYKLSWNPQFHKQSKQVIATEDYDEQVDNDVFDHHQFEQVTGSLDLLKKMLGPYWSTVGQILTVSVLIQVLGLASVLLASSSLSPHPWLDLPLLAGLYLLLRLSVTLLSNLRIFSGNRMAAEMTGSLIHRIGHHVANLSPGSEKFFSSGNLKTMAITDSQTVGELVHSTANRGIGYLIAPFLAPIVLYYLAGWAGIAAYFSMLLMVPFSVFSSNYMRKNFDQELKHEDDCTTITGEWIKHQKTARMMQAVGFFEDKIKETKRLAFRFMQRGMYWAAFTFGVATRWWVIPPVVVVAVVYQFNQQLSPDEIVGITWYLILFMDQLLGIPELIIRGGKTVAAFKRLSNLLTEPVIQTEFNDDKRELVSGKFEKVSLSNVSLQYGEETALHEINLEIDLSKKIAIVGRLGSGKSSLLKLISGQLFPSTGSIELHQEAASYSIRQEAAFDQWREQQVLVNQESFVETSNIKNNVIFQDHQRATLGEESAESQLLQSIYDAAMEEDLKNFRRGLLEPLGETGINLSGGQKQRLNLARAHYFDRGYMILDDPLSAVDEAVADHIWNRIKESQGGFLIATHRLKYVQECDLVIVMENGQIVESGKPEMLLQRPDSAFIRMREHSQLEGKMG